MPKWTQTEKKTKSCLNASIHQMPVKTMLGQMPVHYMRQMHVWT